jgi:hypothetical protein
LALLVRGLQPGGDLLIKGNFLLRDAAAALFADVEHFDRFRHTGDACNSVQQ